MILKKGKKFIEIKSEYDQKYVEARLAGVDTDDILYVIMMMIIITHHI